MLNVGDAVQQIFCLCMVFVFSSRFCFVLTFIYNYHRHTAMKCVYLRKSKLAWFCLESECIRLPQYEWVWVVKSSNKPIHNWTDTFLPKNYFERVFASLCVFCRALISILIFVFPDFLQPSKHYIPDYLFYIGPDRAKNAIDILSEIWSIRAFICVHLILRWLLSKNGATFAISISYLQFW